MTAVLRKVSRLWYKLQYSNFGSFRNFRWYLLSRRWRLFKDFNLSLDEFNAILKKQNYSCKICERTNFTGYNWHVDHCHVTNKIRGILCSKCNQGLGLFEDSIETLNKAKKYLEDFTNGSPVT